MERTERGDGGEIDRQWHSPFAFTNSFHSSGTVTSTDLAHSVMTFASATQVCLLQLRCLNL